MINRISLSRFIYTVMVSFILLTFMSIQWIPFDYPTASWHRVLYWQIRDQLFIRHKYFLVFLFISVILGVLFSIRLKGKCRKVQRVVGILLLFIWVWIMCFESVVA